MLLGTAFVAASLLLASPVAVAGPEKTGAAICMAHVRGTDALIFSFGGKGTTDVTSIRNFTGWHTVARWRRPQRRALRLLNPLCLLGSV